MFFCSRRRIYDIHAIHDKASINCFAGLASMACISFDLPKIKKNMDRLHTHFRDQNQDKSKLFKQLFLFQTELERYDDEEFRYQVKIQELMHLIDTLLELIIDETYSEYFE